MKLCSSLISQWVFLRFCKNLCHSEVGSPSATKKLLQFEPRVTTVLKADLSHPSEVSVLWHSEKAFALQAWPSCCDLQQSSLHTVSSLLCLTQGEMTFSYGRNCQIIWLILCSELKFHVSAASNHVSSSSNNSHFTKCLPFSWKFSAHQESCVIILVEVKFRVKIKEFIFHDSLKDMLPEKSSWRILL